MSNLSLKSWPHALRTHRSAGQGHGKYYESPPEVGVAVLPEAFHLQVKKKPLHHDTALHYLCIRYNKPYTPLGAEVLLDGQVKHWNIENHQGQTPWQLLKPKYQQDWQ